MNDFIMTHFGSVAIISLCAIVFIAAMVIVAYKDKLKEFKSATADEDFFNPNNPDWLNDEAQKTREFLLLNPANSSLPGNVFYKAPPQ